MGKIKEWFFRIYNIFGFQGLFIIGVIIIYIISYIINPKKTAISLLKSFSTFSNWIWILGVVFALMVIFDLYFTKEKIIKLFRKKSLSWIIAIISGILSTGPIYMWYPLLKDLMNKGVKTRYIVAFLYNRAIKVALLYAMVSIFGIKTVSVLLITMILFSIINSIIVEQIVET